MRGDNGVVKGSLLKECVVFEEEEEEEEGVKRSKEIGGRSSVEVFGGGGSKCAALSAVQTAQCRAGRLWSARYRVRGGEGCIANWDFGMGRGKG